MTSAYGNKQLDHGNLPVLQLPTDRPRAASQTFRGANHRFALPGRLCHALQEVSQETGSTLFTLLVTAYQTLLYRYTGQEDLVVGTPNAIDGQRVGLRTRIAGDASFRTLLHENQVAEKEPFQTGFQALFSLNGATELEQEWQKDTTIEIALKMGDQEAGDGFDASLTYNADLFEAETIARMADNFLILLESIVSDVDLPVSRLNLLTTAERHKLMVEWNDTTTEYGKHLSIGQLFEEQVAQTPDAIALEYGEQQWTYRELNERVNQLTHSLRKQGVDVGVQVGICMERSLEMIVGMLAILKAGGTYVPLDPAYPQERLTFMLEDAQVAVLVTEQHLMNALPEHGARVILLDSDREAIAQENTENPDVVVDTETLAYVIFTSGSTGRPKGVCVPHRAVARLVKNTDYVRFTAEEVFLQFAPISFDASIFEIFGSLLNGAKLVVFPAGKASLEEIGDVIQRHGVTTLWLTAGLFHQMVEGNLAGLQGVRQLLAGGDVLSVPHVKKVLQQLPGVHVINGYGPTESTTFTCCHTVTADSSLGGSVPIGRPIANTQIYILDRHLEPVPTGVAGELYIGGD
ncbi:MAG: non-ribosomal peptide synthetase, partial [Tumebacillaceae bacterium]